MEQLLGRRRLVFGNTLTQADLTAPQARTLVHLLDADAPFNRRQVPEMAVAQSALLMTPEVGGDV